MLKRGPSRKYPWEAWLGSSRTVKLVKGRDFKCAVRIMAQQARNRAALMGVTVRIVRDGNAILITNLRRIGRA